MSALMHADSLLATVASRRSVLLAGCRFTAGSRLP